jgi:hypothetical protein
MNATAQREAPYLCIFWVAQTLDQAEPYGECLTYGPGHYETWAHWRRDRTVDPALRATRRRPSRSVGVANSLNKGLL